MNDDLKFAVTCIGSLPHDDVNKAFDEVYCLFYDFPFLPQLVNVNKFENMTFQFLENLACLKNQNGKLFCVKDYEEIKNASKKVEDYHISHCSSMNLFTDYLRDYSPKYAKAQVTGPFTLSMILKNEKGEPVFYDRDLRELLITHLSYKAFWLAEKIMANNVKPVIFIDEPTIAMVGPYSDIKRYDVVDMLFKIVENLKANGIIVGIHCCSKCDWSMIIDAGADILSFDAFSFATDFASYSDKINEYINNGGKICWGIIPTMSDEILEPFTIDSAYIGYYLAVNYLVEKGISKDKILNASMLSPSCGMGNLSVELSHKAMILARDLSLRLKET